MNLNAKEKPIAAIYPQKEEEAYFTKLCPYITLKFYLTWL